MKRRTFPRVRPEKQPEHHHNVYVVLFDPAVGRVRKVRAAIPKRERKKPCVYVGMTGLAAPSAAATDPWRFVVVKNREMLSRIADALPYGKMIGSAALSIVVCGDLEAAHDKQLSYLLQDCSAAIENLLLCAHVLGLGACWLGVHPREQRVKHLQEIFGLKEAVIPVACIAIGYPAETKEPRMRFNPAYVRFEK